ncbi:MAG: hypothetical protein ACOVQY_01225 [Erythrobacter sp.]
MNKKTQFTNADWRLFQALDDIQEALSALTFFMDVPERISEIERRRFRCYHDMMAVSYWRPFSQSKGLPSLGWAALGIKPSPDERALHKRIGDYRNKLVAHTDMAKMRIKVKAMVVGDREDDFPRYPIVVKDVGFEFLNDQRNIENWLWKLRSSLQEKTFRIVQAMPADETVTIDYLI